MVVDAEKVLLAKLKRQRKKSRIEFLAATGKDPRDPLAREVTLLSLFLCPLSSPSSSLSSLSLSLFFALFRLFLARSILYRNNHPNHKTKPARKSWQLRRKRLAAAAAAANFCRLERKKSCGRQRAQPIFFLPATCFPIAVGLRLLSLLSSSFAFLPQRS